MILLALGGKSPWASPSRPTEVAEVGRSSLLRYVGSMLLASSHLVSEYDVIRRADRCPHDSDSLIR